MLKLKKVLLICSLLITSVSLASGSKEDHSQMNHSGRKMLSMNAKKEVITMLEANEVLHNSYFKYDGKVVEAAAQKMSIEMGKITDPEISKLLKFAQGKLGDIKSSNSRDINNINYHIVSMALIHIVNKYDVGSYNAYSCPMVKMKWVQNSNKADKVENPYASNMPGCGSKDSRF